MAVCVTAWPIPDADWLLTLLRDDDDWFVPAVCFAVAVKLIENHPSGSASAEGAEHKFYTDTNIFYLPQACLQPPPTFSPTFCALSPITHR